MNPLGPGGVGRNTAKQRDQDRQTARTNGGNTGWGSKDTNTKNGLFSKPQTNTPKTLAPIAGITETSKPTERSKDPRPDTILQNMSGVNQATLTDIQKTVLEAKRQREALSTGVQVGAAIAPSVIGSGITLGNFMGSLTEDDAMKNPENYRTNKKDPGSLYSKSGPVSTNRAIELPSDKSVTSNAGGEVAEPEKLKKKQQPLPTLLGASANPLGTFSNPVMIT